MPDLVSHALFGHVIRRGCGLISGKSRSRSLLTLFYLGIILPDLFTRPVYILFPNSHSWTLPLHTPFGMLLVCLFVSLLFDRTVGRSVFVALCAGAGLHFLLDLFQKQVFPNNYWFFPLTYKTFQLGIIWASDFIVLIPFAVVVVGIGELAYFLYKKKRRID